MATKTKKIKAAGRLGAGYQCYVIKNLFEEFRRLGDLIQGIGSNLQPYHVTEVLRNGKFGDGIGYAGGRLKSPLKNQPFVTTQAYWAFKRVYNPALVCLDVFDKNLFAETFRQLEKFTHPFCLPHPW